jgi:hypothetical protein
MDAQSSPGPLDTHLTWTAASDVVAGNGAYLESINSCTGNTNPVQIALRACAAGDVPGCVDLTFDDSGLIGGTLIHPNGTMFTAQSGSAEISLLSLDLVYPPASGQPPDLAAGTFRIRFQAGASGLYLNGTFALRVDRSFLAC